jgi:hypothetical protein
MNIDFITILEDDYTIKVYDVSNNVYTLPSTIFDMTIDIISSKIPNGQIDNKLDVISYLRNGRIAREIYTIKSETLGLANSVIIPDGVYHFTYVINNNYTKENAFLVFNTVKQQIEQLLKDVNYDIEIGDYDVEYVGDTSTYDIEKIRLAVTLYDSLVAQTQEPDEVAVNDTLDKLTRLLEIINNDLNT